MSEESKAERCPLCGGLKEPGKTTYTVDLGPGIVVVRNVPASVCEQCGEAWIGAKTAPELETIVKEASRKAYQVQVLSM